MRAAVMIALCLALAGAVLARADEPPAGRQLTRSIRENTDKLADLRDQITAQRERMIQQIQSSGELQLERVASALVRPVAARFDDPDGGLAYIRISAQLAATNTLQFLQGQEAGVPYGSNMTPLWAPFLEALPRPVQDQRLSLIVGMLFHGLADHALYRDSGDAGMADTELMLCNLIDSICAVIRAPVSGQTRAVLEAFGGASPNENATIREP